MHRSLWALVVHSSFTEGLHTTKNTASGLFFSYSVETQLNEKKFPFVETWLLPLQEGIRLSSPDQKNCLPLPPQGRRVHPQGQGRGQRLPFLQEGNRMSFLLQPEGMPLEEGNSSSP